MALTDIKFSIPRCPAFMLLSFPFCHTHDSSPIKVILTTEYLDAMYKMLFSTRVGENKRYHALFSFCIDLCKGFRTMRSLGFITAASAHFITGALRSFLAHSLRIVTVRCCNLSAMIGRLFPISLRCTDLFTSCKRLLVTQTRTGNRGQIKCGVKLIKPILLTGNQKEGQDVFPNLKTKVSRAILIEGCLQLGVGVDVALKVATMSTPTPRYVHRASNVKLIGYGINDTINATRRHTIYPFVSGYRQFSVRRLVTKPALSVDDQSTLAHSIISSFSPPVKRK